MLKGLFFFELLTGFGYLTIPSGMQPAGVTVNHYMRFVRTV